MAKAEKGTLEKGVELSKRADIVAGAFGVVVGNAPLVAFAAVSYFAGNEFGKWLEKRKKKK